MYWGGAYWAGCGGAWRGPPPNRLAPGRGSGRRWRGRRLLAGLLQLPLQSLHAVLRLDQRVLLHECHLGDAVAGLRTVGEQAGDQRICLLVDRRQRRRASLPDAGDEPAPGQGATDPLDETCDEVAFLVGHWVSPRLL
jgi:hypothetical protein